MVLCFHVVLTKHAAAPRTELGLPAQVLAIERSPDDLRRLKSNCKLRLEQHRKTVPPASHPNHWAAHLQHLRLKLNNIGTVQIRAEHSSDGAIGHRLRLRRRRLPSINTLGSPSLCALDSLLITKENMILEWSQISLPHVFSQETVTHENENECKSCRLSY